MLLVPRIDACSRTAHPRKGAIVVFVALMLIVVMALFALALDVGYVCAVKADLQSAVDAGALAGTGAIIDGADQAAVTARQFTSLNLNSAGVRAPAGKMDVTVDIGRWNPTLRQFDGGATPQDAVRVTARIDNASLFFGRALGSHAFSSAASAVAVYRPRDIMLVLDVSGSMAESRNSVAKIDELATSVELFMNYLEQSDANDRVGFSYYASTATLGSGLSDDLFTVKSQIQGALTPGGYTNIADGMQLAVAELVAHRRPAALPLVILLTDGAANMNQPGDWVDATEAKARVIQRAHTAQQSGIPVFTIALDSLTGAVDVSLMQQVADITGSESAHILAGEPSGSGATQLEALFYRVAADRPLRIVE